MEAKDNFLEWQKYYLSNKKIKKIQEKIDKIFDKIESEIKNLTLEQSNIIYISKYKEKIEYLGKKEDICYSKIYYKFHNKITKLNK